MTMARMLDQQLIDDLHQRLRQQDRLPIERLRPGLSDEQIDQTITPLGLALPDEVRRWYRWQDGSSGFPIIASRAFRTLQEDIDFTLELRERDDAWKASWLKVMDERPYIAFDCSGAADAPVAVWHYDYSFDLPTRPVFASIGDMVSFWIALIDEEQIIWNSDVLAWRRSETISEKVVMQLGGVPND